MEGISEILPRALRRLGGTKQVRQAQVQSAFAAACGEYIRPHARVIAVEGSAIVVACAHPAIAHQLQIESAAILESVNHRVGGRALRRLRFLAEAGSPSLAKGSGAD
ncbi:MAG: DUF721 domain-containing protein [Candidatus Dormibacteria bacterium]